MFSFEINIYMYQTSIFGPKIKTGLKIARTPKKWTPYFCKGKGLRITKM